MGYPTTLLTVSRYRPESRETVEHRDPRALLAELQEEVAAILGDIEALQAEMAEPGAPRPSVIASRRRSNPEASAPASEAIAGDTETLRVEIGRPRR